VQGCYYINLRVTFLWLVGEGGGQERRGGVSVCVHLPQAWVPGSPARHSRISPQGALGGKT